ncbi:family Taurine catabolism dioxygenase [Fusarium napiforme]|uniref:Family Taurine catabolism dioxygenase n=1 Tax=Fusarium napiforme TaxID=42672 RepID=A0A8H5N5M7_9HYPO|nr:family Taurine catabolism dioxygenase [Fusarium napiforme]
MNGFRIIFLMKPTLVYTPTPAPSPNESDKKFKISRRQVVAFRAEDELTKDLRKRLILKLGELTRTPKTSSLQVHPVRNNERTPGGKYAEISTISSLQTKNIYTAIEKNRETMKKANGEGWHTDVAYEPVPASYNSLRLTELPRTGGCKMPNYTHIILQNLTCMSKIRFGPCAIVA